MKNYDKGDWEENVQCAVFAAGAFLVTVALGFIVLIVLVTGCTTAQRDWKANTSIDMGAGTQDAEPEYAYGYIGASYWLDYGVSVTGGVWKTVAPYWGPYFGINYSVTPFE